MRRLNLALLAAVQLAGARQQTFSIHDDLVAYPEYEIVFSESYISKHDAEALLDRSNTHATYSADFSSQSDLASHVRQAAASDGDAHQSDEPKEVYELMHFHPSKYLCSIPILEPIPPHNETANQLAKQEEARELARASAAGWELLDELDGSCLYFMSGWWSYSFCYNRQIVQFHALPMMPNGKPPVRDPSTMEFVLGRAPKSASKQNQQNQQNQEQQAIQGHPPAGTELQVKGDQRYLVQRLDSGTVCDLTGRDRTIEIQYHCVPGMKGDRIAWIKEVTTCAYLMVVNTPRLCNDVAFLPPLQSTANPISCRLILDTDDPTAEAEWHRLKTLEAEATMTKGGSGGEGGSTKDPLFAENERPDLDSGTFYKHDAINIGGVVVGARKVLGQADTEGKQPTVLKPPTSYLPNKAKAAQPADEAAAESDEVVTVIATKDALEDGGEYWELSDEEMEALDLDRVLMEQMREEMEKQAKDRGWSLELAEGLNGDRELRGYLEGDESDLPESHKKKKKKPSKNPGTDKAQKPEGGQAEEVAGTEEDDGDAQGSEEKFYDGQR